MRDPLPKPLRNDLEKAVLKARETAEEAARAALVEYGVADPAAPAHLDADGRRLRNALRARARALGGALAADGTQKSAALREEIAYEHWHRMLFARFLAENGLLVYDDGSGVPIPVSLGECAELAPDLGFPSPWAFAASCAAKMLPGVFREDSLSWRVSFPPDRQKALEDILAAIDPATFQASDALGWVYQFWQTRRKADVNASGVKIGADELPAVTQLFTEPYMVAFLYDNSLGAWYAAPKLRGRLFASEAEARAAVATPELPLAYLRLVPAANGGASPPGEPQPVARHSSLVTSQGAAAAAPCERVPAAGAFPDWPADLRDFSLLDPCCGSGHFLVAGLLRLVPIRMEREGLDPATAVDRVLSENLHGLELDRRCVELAAFAVALEAWRYPGAGGVRPLPRLDIACVGVAPAGKKADWLALARSAAEPGSLREARLVAAMERMWNLFQDAPTLGSLLEPGLVEGTLDSADWHEVAEVLRAAAPDPTAEGRETAVAAQGILDAVPLLSRKYTLVISNVPYLGYQKMDETLYHFCLKHYPKSRTDLATVFLERGLRFCATTGIVAFVIPQNWLFLKLYFHLRKTLLSTATFRFIARLGAGAFVTPFWDFNIQLLLLDAKRAETNHIIVGIDASSPHDPSQKAELLASSKVFKVLQRDQQRNPDLRILLEEVSNQRFLGEYANAYQGIKTGDDPRFRQFFWEGDSLSHDNWRLAEGGLSKLSRLGYRFRLNWYDGGSLLARLQGIPAFSKWGVSIASVGKLYSMRHVPTPFASELTAIIPKEDEYLFPLFAYSNDPEFESEVRKLDQRLGVTNATFTKIPFDLERWRAVAAEKYPNGLPEPFTDDPTQWIFHGHPCGSVVWDEGAKKLKIGPDRIDGTVLHVAVARLLGYRWPAETSAAGAGGSGDAPVRLAPEMRAVMARNAALDAFADDDGIVCLPALRGERTAADRLEALLAAAYGPAWRGDTLARLLEAEGSGARTLEAWLRDKFFLRHAKLFGSRPFVWQVWDGLKDGFSALLLCHKLDRRRLESLAYSYLGDWITRQGADAARGVDGAVERQDAAKALQGRLAKILEGEAPYDIFVRWKDLAHQPVGWDPDPDDGVRLNIRPFCEAGVLRESAKKLNLKWDKDRGADLPSAPWYPLFHGERRNDHHTTLAEKAEAKEAAKENE